MKVIGLTGGIGSGKTTVAMLFKEYGIPVYIADDEAKRLMNTSSEIKRGLCELLGDRAYVNDSLDRKYVADIVFKNPEVLNKVNAIVHPEVSKHFKEWLKEQSAQYCIKEAAILFESGSYKDCDLTILVKAPFEERIKRVMKRDHVTKKDIMLRMKHQWTDEIKEGLADIILDNTNIETTKLAVKEIHESLMKNE